MVMFARVFPDSNLWNACLDLYLTSFPSDERRESSELMNIAHTEGYKLMSFAIDDQLIGILEIWDFSNFLFLEHLAVKPEHQKKGYGSMVLQHLLSSITEKPVLLEAETPNDDISRKRIAFYERAGFSVLNIDYSQPPYYPGKQSVPMLLLSNHPVSHSNVSSFIDIITKKVYKIS